MDLLKKQIKEKIQCFINENKLHEAINLIDEYLKIDLNDPEIYSMKAIILMIKGNINEAENILNFGLNKDPFNKDLLFNMSYLMDQKRDYKQSLEYFSKANLFNADNDIKINDVMPNYKNDGSKNIKVLHGTMEIANQMYTISEGMKKIGIESKTLNYYPNYSNSKLDYIFDINRFDNINEANTETKKLASRMITDYDVFHFHFGTSLVIDNSDLPLLKKIGKKAIMQHWGSDVRLYSKAVKYSPNVKVKMKDENFIKRELQYLSTYISNCAVCDYELYDYVKDYYENVHIINQSIDLNRFKMNSANNKKMLIVHAPTNREVKGTDYIIKAIDDLKLTYDFDFKLIENISYEESIKIYEKADIVVDQLLIGSYGLVAIENMALGKPVLCYINERMKEKYPAELPIISCGIENIKEKIEYLIKNQDSLKEIGLKGRKYVEKYHDINTLNSEIIKIYKKL
jgi:Glycosyltransferase